MSLNITCWNVFARIKMSFWILWIHENKIVNKFMNEFVKRTQIWKLLANLFMDSLLYSPIYKLCLCHQFSFLSVQFSSLNKTFITVNRNINPTKKSCDLAWKMWQIINLTTWYPPKTAEHHKAEKLSWKKNKFYKYPSRYKSLISYAARSTDVQRRLQTRCSRIIE